MKKITKILLIILLILGFKVNVLAEPLPTEPTLGEKSNDATLKSITINSQTGICDDKVCKLEITDNDVTNVTITYNFSSDKASLIEGKNEVTLKNGENRFEVTVQAEDEQTTKEYTIIIVKNSKSTDSSLKKLIVNGETITLKGDTTRYNASVSFSAKSITVEAIPNSDKAKIENANNNKITYDFYEDKKEIRIKVISEAGDATTYIVTVTKRPEEDATLRDLKIENYDIDFSKDVMTYEVTVLKNVNQLDIKATPTDTDANVKINAPTTLEIGENTISIIVTNDGNVKTYTIKVTKLDQEDKSLANLKYLKVEGYDLDFKPDKYEYDLKIGDINRLNIEYEPSNPDATATDSGNLNLENHSIIKIRVTYTSGLTNVYRINIIKDDLEAKNSSVSKIIIIVVIVLIIIAGIVIFIIQCRNKKNGKNNNKKSKKKTLDVIEDENLDKQFENIGVMPNDNVDIDDEIEDII